MMLKPKVLPGWLGGTSDLLWYSVFFLAPICGSLEECEWKQPGVIVSLCHTQWLSFGPLPSRGGGPLHHQEGAGWDTATCAGSAGAPCSCSPLQGLAQYRGSPAPPSYTNPLVLCHRSGRGDERCAARCRPPQCEYGAHAPEESWGGLGTVLPVPLQLCPRGQWVHQASASCLEGCGRLAGDRGHAQAVLEGLWAPMGGSRRSGLHGRTS